MAKTVGFDVKVTLKTLGKNKQTYDISRYVNSLEWSFKNNTYMPVGHIEFYVPSDMSTQLSNTYEMSIEIKDKAGSSTNTRSKCSADFICEPSKSYISAANKQTGSQQRFLINQQLLPKNIISTNLNEYGYTSYGETLKSALTKDFKQFVGGGTKFKLGSVSNGKSYDSIMFPVGRFANHLIYAKSLYGVKDGFVVSYSDFHNFYFHSSNETLKGDSTPITLMYNKDYNDTKSITKYTYFIIDTPTITPLNGTNRSLYSSTMNIISHPSDEMYKTSSINLKSQAKTSNSSSFTESFNYYDLYRKSTNRLVSGTDNTIKPNNILSSKVQSSFLISFTIRDPFVPTDFVIGRKVKCDTSVTEYLGYAFTGNIVSFTIRMISNNGSRWTASATLAIASSSNGVIVK